MERPAQIQPQKTIPLSCKTASMNSVLFAGHFMHCMSTFHSTDDWIWKLKPCSSRPFEISSQNRADAFIPKFNCFLNLFSISHKYHFESLETWAKELLVHHCIPNGDGKHSILDSPHICNELMLRLAIWTNLDALSRAAENALVNRLKDHFDSDSLIRSLALAEELGMRKFQSRLYYNELMRRESLQTGIQLLTASTQTNNFTEKQSHALFRGYWSLTRYWKDLPSIVRNRPLPSLTSCEDHGRCQNEWNIKWAVDKFNQHIDPSPLDFGPLQKLEKIRSLFFFSPGSRLTSPLLPTSLPHRVI